MIVPVQFTIQFEQNTGHERQAEADEAAENCKVHLFDARNGAGSATSAPTVAVDALPGHKRVLSTS